MKRLLLPVLAVLLLAPTGFLFAPQKAHAIDVEVVSDSSATSITDLLKNTITSLMTQLTADSTSALQIKEYVLDPIAWALSNDMIQQITGSVLNFIDGNGNGTGSPQFVQDLLGFLQQVGDNQALSFITQFSQNSNSPFTASISSALRTNYLYDSSLGGYFAQNQCTLGQSSPDINAYLNGDWSQGGLSAWFALIQVQNNPYLQYQSAYGEQNSLIASADAAQTQQLSWGQGFLSWCGPSQSGSAEPNPSQLGSTPDTPAGTGTNVSGTTIGSTCLKSDGTAGTIQTPGSIIHDEGAKALGSGFDKLASADEIDEIISQLAQQLISSVLGGSSGGLFGLSQSSDGYSRTFLDQYQGGDTTGANSTPGSNALALANQTLSNVSAYEAAWSGVATAAQNGITTLTNVANSCPAVAGTEQSIIATDLTPILNQAQAAPVTAEATKQFAQHVAAEAQSVTSATTPQLLADTQHLATLTPSHSDLVIAQTRTPSLLSSISNAVQQGQAAATPTLCAPPPSQTTTNPPPLQGNGGGNGGTGG